MFWNDEESAMLESLAKEMNLVIIGDYGAGKTTGLVEAAILSAQAQQDQVTISQGQAPRNGEGLSLTYSSSLAPN